MIIYRGKSKTKNTIDFYNATALDWAKSGYSGVSEIPELLDFARQYPSGSRFLDLCCGCGYDSARIHSLGYEVVGIDFSNESLKIAKERNPDILFYNDNLLNDYSYIGKVDAIVVIAGLVHIETNQLRQAFSRMHDVVQKNGGLFITVREGKGKLLERSLTVIDGEEYDRNFIAHTLDELVDAASGLFNFLQEAGNDGAGWHNYIFQSV